MSKIFMDMGLSLGLPSSIEVFGFWWSAVRWSMHANQLKPRACRSKSLQLQYNTVSQAAAESNTSPWYRKGKDCYSPPYMGCQDI